MGVIFNVLERFNKYFSGLAKISFTEIPEYISLDHNNSKKENIIFIISLLKKANVRIVNGIGDEVSRTFCEELQTIL